MGKRVIVIGASAGGAEAIKMLIDGLPENLAAPIFIVWHMPENSRGLLPVIINKGDGQRAVNAIDGEPIVDGKIYVAPPDRHLLIEKDRVRVTAGPKENRFRPAIDPLFRSAAYVYGKAVIGIVLSGALDDGTAGLWIIKHLGGTTIVQDPAEALISFMPANALRQVDVDHCLSVRAMPAIIQSLLAKDLPENPEKMEEEEKNRLAREVAVASLEHLSGEDVPDFGKLTRLTCPECHGALAEIREDGRSRYRCHTGHAFSAESLLAGINDTVEEALWNVIRAAEERVLLLGHVHEYMLKTQDPAASVYFEKANTERRWITKLRDQLAEHIGQSDDQL